jgi:hypothetical protein
MALEFNFGDLEQKLNNLNRKASNELTDKALQAGGEVILEEMNKRKSELNENCHHLDFGTSEYCICGAKMVIVKNEV